MGDKPCIIIPSQTITSADELLNIHVCVQTWEESGDGSHQDQSGRCWSINSSQPKMSPCKETNGKAVKLKDYQRTINASDLYNT